jgi:hypothetical protein
VTASDRLLRLATGDERNVALFWSRVRREGPDQCWEWIGSGDSNGYGRMSVLGIRQGRKVLAHRMSYALAHGPMVGGAVLHSCDNPGCVNPNHLVLGSQADNVADCVSKRRHGFGDRKRTQAKLTKEHAAEIQASSEPSVSLAEKYGVDPSLISRVRRGLRWRAAIGVAS